MFEKKTDGIYNKNPVWGVAVKWETVIGLEIHVELSTKSRYSAAAPPPSAASPTPMSALCVPGSRELPVLNRRS